MAKYKKRLDGRYMTNVSVGYNENGKPIRKSVYGKTIRELEEKVADVKRQYSTGALIKDETALVSVWAWEWYKTYKTNVAYNTRVMYESIVRVHIVPAIGAMKLKDVRPHHLQKLLNEKGNTRTAQKIYITLNQIFAKAAENDLILKNPIQSVARPHTEKAKKRALTKNEINLINNAELDVKSKAFLYTLLYAGLRRGEIFALTKENIDLEKRTITIVKTLITKGNIAEIKASPKTAAGNRPSPVGCEKNGTMHGFCHLANMPSHSRTIPMPETLHKALIDYRTRFYEKHNPC